ncbi:Swt1 family HEPN domain-containing protein, partial [Methylobacterium sp. P5_C11]
FVFDGMLAKDRLASLAADGIQIDVVTESSVVQRAEMLSFPLRILTDAGRMASVFTLFFCVENSARELVTQRLAERSGESWWSTQVPKKIQEHVDRLRSSEAVHRYHTPRSSELIGYTTFGQIEQIIINCWDEFSDLFPNQAWVSSRFKDLEMSRNIIMHTGILSEFEIDRVENLARDWVRQVG